jgi:hypothetical protein
MSTLHNSQKGKVKRPMNHDDRDDDGCDNPVLMQLLQSVKAMHNRLDDLERASKHRRVATAEVLPLVKEESVDERQPAQDLSKADDIIVILDDASAHEAEPSAPASANSNSDAEEFDYLDDLQVRAESEQEILRNLLAHIKEKAKGDHRVARELLAMSLFSYPKKALRVLGQAAQRMDNRRMCRQEQWSEACMPNADGTLREDCEAEVDTEWDPEEAEKRTCKSCSGWMHKGCGVDMFEDALYTELGDASCELGTFITSRSFGGVGGFVCRECKATGDEFADVFADNTAEATEFAYQAEEDRDRKRRRADNRILYALKHVDKVKARLRAALSA